MPKLSLTELDDYSRVVLPLIMARFPEWELLATYSPRPDGAGSVVELNVPCPSPAAESGLWVSTADEELSVGFHSHHIHFTDYEDRVSRGQIDAGIQHAADILAERVGVVSWYCGGSFTGSVTVELPHPDPLPNRLDAFGSFTGLLGAAPTCDRITLRSWTGRFDREE